MMGGRARADGGGAPFEPEEFAAAPGQDAAASVTISLSDLAHGGSRRVYLPGKEVDVKIPAGLRDGRQIRLKGQGFAGAGGAPGDAIITVNIAKRIPTSGATARMSGLNCRSRFTRRYWAARSVCRHSTVQWSLRFRPIPTAAYTFRLKARACLTRPARAI